METKITGLKYNNVKKGGGRRGDCLVLIVIVCCTAAPCMESAGVPPVTFFAKAYCLPRISFSGTNIATQRNIRIATSKSKYYE